MAPRSLFIGSITPFAQVILDNSFETLLTVVPKVSGLSGHFGPVTSDIDSPTFLPVAAKCLFFGEERQSLPDGARWLNRVD